MEVFLREGSGPAERPSLYGLRGCIAKDARTYIKRTGLFVRHRFWAPAYALKRRHEVEALFSFYHQFFYGQIYQRMRQSSFFVLLRPNTVSLGPLCRR